MHKLPRMPAGTTTAKLTIKHGDVKIRVRHTALPTAAVDTALLPSVLASSTRAMTVCILSAGVDDEPTRVEHSVNASMVGIFHAVSSPTNSPFVVKGSFIQPNSPINAIKAPKTIDEATSDIGASARYRSRMGGQGVELVSHSHTARHDTSARRSSTDCSSSGEFDHGVGCNRKRVQA